MSDWEKELAEKETQTSDLYFENEKLRCQLKEMQMVIAEKEAMLEKDFNSEVKKERLYQVSLKVLPMIIDKYKLNDAVTESKRVARMLLDESI